MWAFFEPELKKRLAEMDKEDSGATQVRSALMDLLPTRRATLDNMAKQLEMSKRTMPRRLEKEVTTFHKQLNGLPEKLAYHYLLQGNFSRDCFSAWI